MFNILGGNASGGGGSGAAINFPPLNEGVTFDETEAASDFTNQLMPPPAAMRITQPLVDEATQAGGGAGDIPPPPGGPIPPRAGAAREYPAADKELQEGEPTLG
jgi:hypothetical protein